MNQLSNKVILVDAHSILTNVKIFFDLSFWSVLGCLSRIALSKLTYYDNNYVHNNGVSVVWVNFTACFIMGYINSSAEVWENLLIHDLEATDTNGTYKLSKVEIPLYIGLTTGYCGTFSSFSSYILEILTKTLNLNGGAAYPTTGYGTMEFFAVLLTQLGLSIFGYRMGKELGNYVDHNLGWKFSRSMISLFDFIIPILGFALDVLMLVLSCALHNHDFWKPWSLACCFAPFGCYLRYYLALKFNTKSDRIFIGTYLANFIAVLVLAITTLLSYGKKPYGGDEYIVDDYLSCLVLDAISIGFSGSLSTVSTFVAELFGFGKVKDRYIYGSFSICSCFVLMMLILGVYNWVVGLNSATFCEL
ncbi:hypothetical protein PACTADRAFT_67665 [Pachysolen tannophilus NRRL Y-2460]|uniref:Fluoride ion transporter CrcB n=1 Tax=Pachysolen tannophilus NRRL Y-2460 TaxID=669874 RepID=A0A1E4TX07_PACTA|nr:hypothetical protein PACTADRAFT_67665 [Pachysolen tannophilus NRRL Y-2460]